MLPVIRTHLLRERRKTENKNTSFKLAWSSDVSVRSRYMLASVARERIRKSKGPEKACLPSLPKVRDRKNKRRKSHFSALGPRRLGDPAAPHGDGLQGLHSEQEAWEGDMQHLMKAIAIPPISLAWLTMRLERGSLAK